MRNIPILFLIYNRPEITTRTFLAIRKLKPKNLFIAADGPKSGDIKNMEKCDRTRRTTEKIDWECDIKRLYRDKHIGLKGAVYEAITWFFNNVNEGIILEDDCLISEPFVNFCQEMLSKYRNNPKVMHIGGSNFLPKEMHRKDGYYFSKYDNVWGWATWSRAWKKMDYQMKNWHKFVKSEKFRDILPNRWEVKYWQVLANAVISGRINSWAYRWQFTIWENGGTSISPGVNLVENIGLAFRGTHINTNVKKLDVKTETIDKNLMLLGDDYSNTADEYVRRHIYRVSPGMVFAQWAYHLLRGVQR